MSKLAPKLSALAGTVVLLIGLSADIISLVEFFSGTSIPANELMSSWVFRFISMTYTMVLFSFLSYAFFHWKLWLGSQAPTKLDIERASTGLFALALLIPGFLFSLFWVNTIMENTYSDLNVLVIVQSAIIGFISCMASLWLSTTDIYFLVPHMGRRTSFSKEGIAVALSS